MPVQPIRGEIGTAYPEARRTATPGTFYLAGPFRQAAVRVNPGTSRVRLLVWSAGRQWTER